jgi:hypothetical protein
MCVLLAVLRFQPIWLANLNNWVHSRFRMRYDLTHDQRFQDLASRDPFEGNMDSLLPAVRLHATSPSPHLDRAVISFPSASTSTSTNPNHLLDLPLPLSSDDLTLLFDRLSIIPKFGSEITTVAIPTSPSATSSASSYESVEAAV